MSSETLTHEIVVQAFARRWRAFVALVVAAPVLASAAWSAVPDRYEARARVTVQDPQTVNPFLGDLAVEWDAEERSALITSILRSPSTVEQVLRETGALSERATPDEIEREVRSFAERTQVIEVGGGVVLLKLTATEPDAAYHGVRGLVDAFVREMLRPQRENVVASAEFLRRQLDTLEREIGALERRITIYRQEHADEVPEMREATLAEHRALRTALLESEVRVQSTARQVATTEERLRALSPRERSIEGLLTEARTELSRSRAELGDDHPRVAQARTRVALLQTELGEARRSRSAIDLDRLDAQIASGPAEIDGEGRTSAGDVLTSELLAYRSMLRERAGAEAEVSMLRERIEQSRSTLVSSIAVEEELARMTRELVARRAVHAELLERAEQARVMRDLAVDGDLQQVWVLEPPVLPTTSLKPARWMVVLGALGGALVLGALAVALAEASAAYARTAESAARAVGAPTAGVLPRMRGRR